MLIWISLLLLCYVLPLSFVVFSGSGRYPRVPARAFSYGETRRYPKVEGRFDFPRGSQPTLV